MLAKADYDDVTCSPPCRLPTLEKVERRNPPATLERAVKLVHPTLRRIEIEALDERNAKGDYVGIFQRFVLTPGNDRRPQQSAKTLAVFISERASSFARERDQLVKFRVYLKYHDEAGRLQEKQTRLIVDPSRLEDPDDEEDDDEEDAEDNYEKDAEEEEDDREEEEDGREEYDEDDDNFEDIVNPPPPAAPRGHSNGNGHPRDVAEQYVPATPAKLEPQMQIHSSIGQAQAMGLQPDLSGGLPLEQNPMFFLQLMDRQAALVARIFHGNMRESRKERRLMQREMIGTLQEARRTMRAVTDSAIRARDNADRHAENLGQQIIDITTAQRADIVNYQEIAAHSWKAFRHAQEAELSMAGRILGYERALFDERLAAAEERAALPAATSQWPGMLKGAMPTLLGVGAFIANQKGDSKMAELLGSLATLLAPKPEYEEEGDDEDEDGDDEQEQSRPPKEDVVDAEARDVPPDAPPKPAPTRDGARALLETIDAEQANKLRTTLPRGAWEAFEQTASARTESSARLHVKRLDELVRSNTSAHAAVMGALRPEQLTSLMSLVSTTQRRGVPPRPRASSAG